MHSTPTTSSTTDPTCRQCGQQKTAVPSVADANVTLYTCERCEVSRPSTSSTDEEVRTKIRDIMQWYKLTPGTIGGSDYVDQIMELIRQDREAREAVMRSDIAHAIGYCQGLGQPLTYLENRYPDIVAPDSKAKA